MVVPLHGKEDWMRLLEGLPEFDAGAAPVVFVSPHPDDESLAAGGLLAALREQNVPVTLVAVTDGEGAYTDVPRLGELRMQEQTVAAERLGIAREDILRLHLADRRVGLAQQTMVESLLPLVSAETHLVAPWPHDFHPDHEACGEAALALARQTGARLTFYFFWTWHRGTPGLLETLKLQRFALTAAQQAAKAEALAAHVSQLHHISGDPILHDVHLWPAQLAFEVYLPA